MSLEFGYLALELANLPRHLDSGCLASQHPIKRHLINNLRFWCIIHVINLWGLTRLWWSTIWWVRFSFTSQCLLHGYWNEIERSIKKNATLKNGSSQKGEIWRCPPSKTSILWTRTSLWFHFGHAVIVSKEHTSDFMHTYGLNNLHSYVF
jgi:hypothetical protein